MTINFGNFDAFLGGFQERIYPFLDNSPFVFWGVRGDRTGIFIVRNHLIVHHHSRAKCIVQDVS